MTMTKPLTELSLLEELPIVLAKPVVFPNSNNAITRKDEVDDDEDDDDEVDDANDDNDKDDVVVWSPEEIFSMPYTTQVEPLHLEYDDDDDDDQKHRPSHFSNTSHNTIMEDEDDEDMERFLQDLQRGNTKQNRQPALKAILIRKSWPQEIPLGLRFRPSFVEQDNQDDPVVDRGGGGRLVVSHVQQQQNNNNNSIVQVGDILWSINHQTHPTDDGWTFPYATSFLQEYPVGKWMCLLFQTPTTTAAHQQQHSSSISKSLLLQISIAKTSPQEPLGIVLKQKQQKKKHNQQQPVFAIDQIQMPRPSNNNNNNNKNGSYYDYEDYHYYLSFLLQPGDVILQWGKEEDMTTKTTLSDVQDYLSSPQKGAFPWVTLMCKTRSGNDDDDDHEGNDDDSRIHTPMGSKRNMALLSRSSDILSIRNLRWSRSSFNMMTIRQSLLFHTAAMATEVDHNNNNNNNLHLGGTTTIINNNNMNNSSDPLAAMYQSLTMASNTNSFLPSPLLKPRFVSVTVYKPNATCKLGIGLTSQGGYLRVARHNVVTDDHDGGGGGLLLFPKEDFDDDDDNNNENDDAPSLQEQKQQHTYDYTSPLTVGCVLLSINHQPCKTWSVDKAIHVLQGIVGELHIVAENVPMPKHPHYNNNNNNASLYAHAMVRKRNVSDKIGVSFARYNTHDSFLKITGINAKGSFANSILQKGDDIIAVNGMVPHPAWMPLDMVKTLIQPREVICFLVRRTRHSYKTGLVVSKMPQDDASTNDVVMNEFVA